MNFRANFKYHVMNLNSGTVIHSADTEEEAEAKAISYAINGGNPHAVLKEVCRTAEKRSIVVSRN